MTNRSYEFNDMTNEFEFEKESLDYDAPVSGRLRNKKTDNWFAFDCTPTIGNPRSSGAANA